MLSFHILLHLLLNGQQTLRLCQFVSHKILLSVYSAARDEISVNIDEQLPQHWIFDLKLNIIDFLSKFVLHTPFFILSIKLLLFLPKFLKTMIIEKI